MRKIEYNFNLYRAIRDAGFTQAAIAEKCGISTSVMSQIVNGRVNPSDTEAAKLCDALGRSKSHLFKE